MKLKKIMLFVLIGLIIFSTSITVFATDTKITNEIKKEDLIPALEEKLKAKEESQKNKENNSEVFEKDDEKVKDSEKKENSVVDNETNKLNEKDKNDREKIEEDVIENDDKKEDIQKVYKDEILKDLVITGSESDIEYKSKYIDGNVFILTSVNVTLKECKVKGDIFVLAESLELDSVEVNGSIYIGGATQTKINASMDSLYAFGENIEIGEYSEIKKELRVIGENFKLEGYVGRDAYIIATNSNILEDAEIEGDCTIQAEESNISDEAEIDGKTDVTIVEINNVGFNSSLESYLPEAGTEFFIFLIVAIFIIGGFPKFVDINNRLHLKDFIKSFFVGLLTIIIVMLIVLGLCVWGYGIGYAFAFAILTGVLLGLGKLIFIVAFAIRISGKSESISKIKMFFMTVFVALVIEIIGMITILGTIGFFAIILFNIVIGISGFGSLIQVILSSKNVNKKKNKLDKNKVNIKDNENNGNNEIKEIIKEDNKKIEQEQLQVEIRKEVEAEIKELMEEKELENKEISSNENKKNINNINDEYKE